MYFRLIQTSDSTKVNPFQWLRLLSFDNEDLTWYLLFIQSFSHGTYIRIVTIYLASNLIGRMVCYAELSRKSQLERAGISSICLEPFITGLLQPIRSWATWLSRKVLPAEPVGKSNSCERRVKTSFPLWKAFSAIFWFWFSESQHLCTPLKEPPVSGHECIAGSLERWICTMIELYQNIM